ncbi:TPA: hypothetical protein N0F65_003147, partial [Lagenidium giganteum]
HDKSARDALRRLTATTVSEDFAKLVHGLTQLIINMEHTFSTSMEQDERTAVTLRESKLRLREVEDDRKQVAFELLKEREARAAMNIKYNKIVEGLREQLKETQRTAADALASNERASDHELHTAHAAFDLEKTNNNEKHMALGRVQARAAEEHTQVEGDERKRKQRVVAELGEVVRRYDQTMMALDDAINVLQNEVRVINVEAQRLATYFDRIDEDRRIQLEEVRAIELAEQMRRRRDLNLFRFVQRLQACVRGFLVRKHLK